MPPTQRRLAAYCDGKGVMEKCGAATPIWVPGSCTSWHPTGFALSRESHVVLSGSVPTNPDHDCGRPCRVPQKQVSQAFRTVNSPAVLRNRLADVRQVPAADSTRSRPATPADDVRMAVSARRLRKSGSRVGHTTRWPPRDHTASDDARRPVPGRRLPIINAATRLSISSHPTA